MRPQNATIARAWRVTPEILALAREPRYTVRMPLGDGRTRDFRLRSFEPREGFRIDEDNEDLVPSDNPEDLSYYWYGENGRDHLALTVVRGRVEGRVYTPAQRLTLSTVGRDHQYQRIDMRVLNRGACAHGRIMRRLAALEAERIAGDDAAAPSGEVGSRLVKDVVSPVRQQPLVAALSKKPTPDTDLAKYRLTVDVVFYFTDVLAEALDDDSDPSRNYVAGAPNAIAIAEVVLGPRTRAYIDEINQSMANSGSVSHLAIRRVGALVRLLDGVGQEVGDPYDELPGITNPFDRFAQHLLHLAAYENEKILGTTMPPPPPGPRREDFEADLAVLMVNDMGNPNDPLDPQPVFGVAYMQRAGCPAYFGTQCGVGPGLVSGEFGLFAYAVVSAAPQTANFTFSHELGHMFGADHQDGQATVPPPPSFAHSFGYVAPNQSVRDIMADPWCGPDFQNDLCPRAQQFSNPEAVFLGTSIPAGTPGGRTCSDPVSCPFTAFTALTIRKNAHGHANIYGPDQPEPLFWDGMEL